MLILIGLIIFITLITLLVLFMLVGENGYKHTCVDANECPASVRCSNEKDMLCYRDKKGKRKI